MLSKKELLRYHRHLIIPEFGKVGQEKLKQAKVLVIGSGGLGAPMLQYLAAAGVGTIGIVDFDVIEDSNLQRQVLFTTADIGRPKAEVAKDRLLAQNPYINVIVHNTYIDSSNALDIIKDYDLVADGTDNFPTRYLVNDACVILGKTNVYASIFRFEGQASVFNELLPDGTRGPNFRDLFPTPPPPGLVPSCAEGGVIGVLPGILGSIQANEVIKVISGVGDTLCGRLFIFDAADFSTRVLNIKKNEKSPAITELIDYKMFCGIPNGKVVNDKVQEISVEQLKAWLDERRDIQIIDVREPAEYELVNINAELIPKSEFEKHVDKIRKDAEVVLHCRSGIRSADVIEVLQDRYGYTNLYNLEGGILAWADKIDTSMITY